MFIDHRFGEYDEKMTLEEKMMKRFTMEKKVFFVQGWKEVSGITYPRFF